MTIEFEKEEHLAKIKVVGVGGCGGNLVNYMSERTIYGVHYLAVNTDTQALSLISPTIDRMDIGQVRTKGLGAGANPVVGEEAAVSEESRLREVVRGLDMVFIAAGMGKGTGTGASPVVARLARDEGVLTVAVVTTPFRFENRTQRAEKGLANLAQYADSIIVVPNDKLRHVLGEEATAEAAYSAANEVLYNAVRGVSDIINKPGLVNVDFNDVRTAMTSKGKAVIGSSQQTGEDRARVAAHAALHSPLMEDINLKHSDNILINITGTRGGVKMEEIYQVSETVEETVQSHSGEMFTGLVFDDDMSDDELRVTVIVTGVDGHYGQVAKPNREPEVIGEAGDSCLVSGRKRQEYNRLLEENGGDVKKVPAVLRQQIS